MEYESIKNNSGIIGNFPGIKTTTGVLHEVLDSDDDREQDDLSSDDSYDNTQSISDESCKEDEDLER